MSSVTTAVDVAVAITEPLSRLGRIDRLADFRRSQRFLTRQSSPTHPEGHALLQDVAASNGGNAKADRPKWPKRTNLKAIRP